MANANTEVNLDTLFGVIEQQIRLAFPSLATVEFDREEASAPPQAPACVLELPEWEGLEGDDPETGQLAINCRFEARLLIGFNRPRAKAEVRKLAMALAAWLHKRTWRAQAHPSGQAQVTGAYRDDFSPVLDKYEAWRVEWTQVIHLGESAFKDTGTPPTAFIRMDPQADPASYAGTPTLDGQHHPIEEYLPLAEFLAGNT